MSLFEVDLCQKMTAELKTAVCDKGRLFLSAAWMNHFLFQGFMTDYEENRLSVDDFLAPLGGFSRELITTLRISRMERRSCSFFKTEGCFSVKVNKYRYTAFLFLILRQINPEQLVKVYSYGEA